MTSTWSRPVVFLLVLSVCWAGVAAFRGVPAHRRAGSGNCGSCHAGMVPAWHTEEFRNPGRDRVARRIHGREALARKGTCMSCHRPRFRAQCGACHQPGKVGP